MSDSCSMPFPQRHKHEKSKIRKKGIEIIKTKYSNFCKVRDKYPSEVVWRLHCTVRTYFQNHILPISAILRLNLQTQFVKICCSSISWRYSKRSKSTSNVFFGNVERNTRLEFFPTHSFLRNTLYRQITASSDLLKGELRIEKKN